MTSHSKWRPLPTFPDLPALLVSPGFDVESSSYSLQVTDLANVWAETLDRKGILRRSLNEDTSIDLSDGDREQWRVFLTKLEAAFDPASPDHKHTSLTLSPHNDSGLTLNIACILPKPLEPLKWPVFLTKRQPDVLASELVVPLIQAKQVLSQEADYLVAKLKEKDAVITRLVDKLQAVGTGLENAFHGLPIKRKVTRAMAEEKVQGLAPFNEHGWRSQCAPTLKAHQDVPSLVSDAFSNGEIPRGRDVKVPKQINDWWMKFGPTSAMVSLKERTTPTVSRASTPQKDKPPADGDDDFQVQATPPSARKNRERRQAATRSGETTDDDNSPIEIPDSHPKAEPMSRPRIGTLGGRKASSRAQPQSQSSRTVPDNDETASESEEEPVKRNPVATARSKMVGSIGRNKQPTPSPMKSSSPAPAPPNHGDDDETESDSNTGSECRPSQKPAPVHRKKGGIGQIGGRSRATPPPADEPGVVSPTSSAEKHPRQRLGTIGKKAGSEAKYRDETPIEPTEEEDMELKAERNRAELAKELGRKAAAPAKKKRRF
ncbi:hypothetical protein DL766_000611 [Monosporascus sp. MC13-8B]|uniref:Non-homologous end-joining factor 1 n=1 Tax=Monosporascus cannonballus TaxID=155416 RepID=A0ABY0GT18_9PEZI|nr:hypothetical protein DL762_009544 [Monosporascus cannonballus]RYO78500.1 hypothetical protein DL763_009625 [Monosporascus cannonballus]RYP38971.1 hypothetical protein DL766_000611 [Monosporascus sp. MC13-8B]